MKITIDKIKTAEFAIRHRLMGYKLLQNCKGTNPNEVTMIKSSFMIADDYCDKIYNTTRIHRKKSGNKFVKEKIEMQTKYLMNPKTYTYSGKNKNVLYFYKFGNIDKFKEKEAIPFEDNDKRPRPNWLTDEVKYDFEKSLFEENKKKRNGYYLPRHGLLERFISSCFKSYEELIGYKTVEHPVEPTFWHVLKTNIQGGGVK